MQNDIFGSISYIPGSTDLKLEPLSRYLPPIPDGILSTWLGKNIPKGAWVLDPFGASPRLAVEAARAGYRILVTANNPIARFLLELIGDQPTTEDLKSSLTDLSASYKGDERIEPHIRSLYNTRCARCGQLISADAFLWEQDALSPYARIYNCSYCGDSGEHPSTQFDVEHTRQFTSSGMHKARALERVVSLNDPDRIHVEHALSVYSPRALYALITIINKIEGLSLIPEEQKLLSALLLHAFDQSNVMWRVPSTRERRRQLTIPRHYRENNIWLALEQGIEILGTKRHSEISSKVPIETWPNLPTADGGICIYEGKLAAIAVELSRLDIKAVCTAIPRPNQAFWTLSALWSGWLWGRDALGSFKSVLHRQRYDWGWHTTALASIFKQLTNLLDPSALIFGLLGEIEPGFIASTLVAARHAGCVLQGVAIRNEEDQAQILWNCKKEHELSRNRASLNEIGSQSAKSYLESRGEPANYLDTISAALLTIINKWSPQIENEPLGKKTSSDQQFSTRGETNPTEPTPSLVYSTIYNSAREALSYRSGFIRFKIQDLLNIEPTQKTQVLQDSLFSLDIGNMNSDEADYSSQPEIEPESAPEKERPIRSSDVSESELLWLRDEGNVEQSSITDNYELAIFNYLATHPGITYNDIDTILCERFPGLYTPDPDFIRICLESYGEYDPDDKNMLHIRLEDTPNARQSDIDTAYTYIHQVGERLGLKSIDQRLGDISSIILEDEDGVTKYRFILTITANITKIVISSKVISGKTFLVIPGSRVNLIIYKLRRDLRLINAFNPTSGNWQFLKFRHLRSLAENPLLNLDNLDQLLKLDPLTFTTPQLRLI